MSISNDVPPTHEAMVPSIKRRPSLILGLAITITAAIAVTMLVLLSPYSTREFHGDGEIEDTGFWTSPRYHVRFAPISLIEPGQHVFRCSGLPHEPLTFRLQIIGESNYDVLKSASTIVDVRLASAEGRTIGRASGPLSEWVLNWTPANRSGAFWHPDLRDIEVPRKDMCSLTIAVADTDSRLPDLEVRPMLSGGGNELP